MVIIRQETDDDDMPWPSDDFTGELVVEWPNGQVKFKSLFRNGSAEGDYLCLWPNGNLAQVGRNVNGKCVGIWSDYRVNGTKYKETEFFSPDNFDVRWLTDDGLVQEIERFRPGRKPKKITLIPDDPDDY